MTLLHASMDKAVLVNSVGIRMNQSIVQIHKPMKWFFSLRRLAVVMQIPILSFWTLMIELLGELTWACLVLIFNVGFFDYLMSANSFYVLLQQTQFDFRLVMDENP